MEQLNYVSCYKFYDYKGRRLAAFARYKDYTEVEIFILTCSKDDQFSRKFARSEYEQYLSTNTTDTKAEVFVFPIEPEDQSLNLLLDFMHLNFYKLELMEVEIPVLVKFNNR